MPRAPRARPLAALAVVLLVAVAPAAAQIVVVVNKANTTRNLSLGDLERLYLGNRTSFDNGEPVVLGEYHPARRAFYLTVLHWSERAVSRYWIGVVFSGRNAAPPVEFRDAESARRFVTTTPGAICFLDLAAVPGDVGVVTIDGRGPRDPAYPLR
ncbi:MAG TPA: hypothetical protein VH137_02725 [Gemmatimonadales bacterium]|nr:hypothetical protein [Gemmatimonadales bacterium]